MIKIVSFKICPFVQRVTARLAAQNIPYEIEYISLKDKPQWFLDISPNGQVPLLITESGTALFESDAIIEYLDEVYPMLESDVTPEQRALDRAWSYLGSKHYLVQCSTMRSADEATLTERREKLAKAFAKAEAALGDGPFFKGEALSNVDIAWLPLLHRAAIIKAHTCQDLLEGFPKVQQWQAAMMATGLAEKSVAEDFEEAFTGFYLSEQTYLGQNKCCDDAKACEVGCC
ncbi:glutathione S-transferase [Photobacterium sanctipauli]|uniref:glutathione transferase n=1 Tax=Photobacterium sanctipauli TaxID=1342794 RepID=A0A2T3NPH4_9GAMM|nr:glutathione S-transferase family protein [Photobacterium sanctipauli]PSW18122.1 glutathione S-transferase [Photobacterium sanctipauli]